MFSAKVVDEGRATSKLDLEYRGNVWIMSKNREVMHKYLKSIGLNSLSELEVTQVVKGQVNTKPTNPRFSTLIFFEFFKKVDPLSQRDGYRHLDLKIENMEVTEAELGIDAATAKTVINLEMAFTFSQEWQDESKKQRLGGEMQSPSKGWRGMSSPPSPGLNKVKETIVYRKTHK